MSSEQYGRYEIKSQLGRGGMATVYLAHDPRFGRDVALKVMNQALQDEPAFRGRFEREARTVATLEHPSIVPVYDYGEDHDQLYLVMRYMKGGSLSERIVQRPLNLEEVLPIFQRIGAALDHAHQEGVIHRDLKPGNILFDEYNNAFLSDFGIVKLAQESVDLTGSGVIGTPAYMSPEQIHGEKMLDGRSDIYTLGIILFECLTGRKPYRADTPVKQMMAHVLNPVPRIRDANPDLPPACEEVIQKALSKERDERYLSAAEFTEALTITLTGLQPSPVIEAKPAEPRPDDLEGPTETISISEPPPPEQKARQIDQADDFVVSPPEPEKEEDTFVGSAALKFEKTPPEQPIPLTQPEPAKKRPWLWLAIGLAVILILTALAAIFTSFLDIEPTPDVAVASPTDTIPPATTPPEETEEIVTEPATAEPTEEVATAVVQPLEPIISQIGQSALGEPLSVHQFGEGEHPVLFVGGLHSGFAPGGVQLAQELIEHFTANPEDIPENVTLFIIPDLNPDSADSPGQLEGRLNGNGVDLNRNWDCRWLADPPWGGEAQPGLGGSEPFSEPEVQALATFIEEQQVEAVVFWQARARLGLSSPGACAEESEVSRPLAQIYGAAADYPVADFEDVAGTVVYGDVTNWLDGQGIPAISVLLPDYRESDYTHNLPAVLAVLEQIPLAESESG